MCHSCYLYTTMLQILQNDLQILMLAVGILGLIVGSFLNVVIHRLPIMLQREWAQQCAELNGQPIESAEIFNLSVPRSRCPHCGHLITALENIPVISYIFLLGKCRGCHQKISLRYPLIEIISAFLAVIVAWHFGFGWQLGAALIFTWALLAAGMIDLDHFLLPDNITLPLLWLGLLCNLFHLYTDISSAVIGAMVGYMSLWSVYWLFKLLTGKEGMGYGDFKMTAMLGAWMGWQWLLQIVLIASLLGSIIGIALILFKRQNKDIPIPFGPYLAFAGWINLLWGDVIKQFLST